VTRRPSGAAAPASRAVAAAGDAARAGPDRPVGQVADGTALSPADEQDFMDLLAKIARDRGFVCGSYKQKCLRRRIAVRLRARGLTSYADYARLLDGDAPEYDKLVDTLTINVTKLFRNWDAFAALARSVIPALWGSPSPTLQVWSAGCASGEEAYSLAALFHRHASAGGERERAGRVRVLGTDIDRESLLAASRGLFAEPAFTDTPPDLRAAYFTEGSPAAAEPAVRALVRFARHDLIREEAPPGQHLIVCRNVIIYFDRDTQERLFERFYGALAPGGYLMLGKVETLLGPARALFTAVDARERIFQRS
jgi:chemotaxis protein methyltransferase CheR